MAKSKKKQSTQIFDVPPQRHDLVGRGGNQVTGVPWYSLYFGIGFGGYNGIYGTGYGNDTGNNETSQNNYGQESSGDGTSESNTGAGAGEGSGVGTM